MGQIGALDEYIVRIEDSALAMGRRDNYTPGVNYALHELPWSSLRWGRVMNDISTASVTIPNDMWGRTMCPYPLHGWDQTLAIYRNGSLVWRGPLLGWRHNEDGLVEISAADVLAFGRKWYVYQDRKYTTTDPLDVISILFSDQPASSPWFSLVSPGLIDASMKAGWWVARTYKAAQMQSLYTCIRSLSEEAGVFFSAGPDFVHYDSDEYYFASASPVLHEGSSVSIPKIAVDCSEVASRVWAVGDDAGVGGFQTIADASMTTRFNQPAYSKVYDLQSLSEPDQRLQGAHLVKAATPSAIHALGPKITIETVELTPTFGGLSSGREGLGSFRGMDSLRPGLRVRWGFDADCLSEVPVYTILDPTAAYDVATYGPVLRAAIWPPIVYAPEDDANKVFATSASIDWMVLVQLDVSVAAAEDGLSEQINASFIPMALSAAQMADYA